MTTITALNVRLGMDVSNFNAGADLAKSEVTKVATIMRQSVPPAEKYKQELDLLNRAFSDAGKKSAEYANAIAHLSSKYKAGTQDQLQYRRSVEQSTKAVQDSSNASSSLASSIKGMAAAYLSMQTVAKSINLASQVQDATIAFEVLTGSAKEGAMLFQQIRKFAAESPITFTGATQAAKTMLSFGVAAQDVEKNLRMLSDVTGGNNDRFKMLSLAFSQTSAAGRLMGQDLLQMINAGFNPLQQISKTTGESLIDLKKRMEAGGISAEEVRRAFEDATAEGGMFHGMTERLSETVSGKLNIALSDLEQKLSKAGEAMGPVISQLLDVFNKMKPVLDAIVNLIDGISQGLGYMLAVLTDTISTLKNFKLDKTETDKFLNALEARERKAAQEKNQQIADEFEKRLNGVEKISDAEKRAIIDAQAAEKKFADDQSAAAKKAAEDAWKEQQKRLKDEEKERLRAIEEWNKAQADAARKAADEFQRELEAARDDAMKFFDEVEAKNKQRRADVAKGPGMGMELGSSDSIKFAADAVNAQIAKVAVPDSPVVLQRDIAAKTTELLMAQRDANRNQNEQIELAKRQLAAIQENGFQRIR